MYCEGHGSNLRHLAFGCISNDTSGLAASAKLQHEALLYSKFRSSISLNIDHRNPVVSFQLRPGFDENDTVHPQGAGSSSCASGSGDFAGGGPIFGGGGGAFFAPGAKSSS